MTTRKPQHQLEQRTAVLNKAEHQLQLATAQENADGDPRVAAEHYATAVELILLALHEFPFAKPQAQQFVMSQYREKLALYIERARLLLSVAEEEEKMMGTQTSPNAAATTTTSSSSSAPAAAAAVFDIPEVIKTPIAEGEELQPTDLYGVPTPQQQIDRYNEFMSMNQRHLAREPETTEDDDVEVSFGGGTSILPPNDNSSSDGQHQQRQQGEEADAAAASGENGAFDNLFSKFVAGSGGGESNNDNEGGDNAASPL